MRARSLLAILALCTGFLVVGPLAEPSAAAVTTTRSGTTITVTATGSANVEFRCSTDQVMVGAVLVSPTMHCALLTQVTVNGDGGNQVVRGDHLDDSLFTARPRLIASLGGGADSVYETAQADTLDLGTGDDWLGLRVPSTPNTTNDLGAGTGDTIAFRPSTFAGTSMVLTSTGASASMTSGAAGTTTTTQVVGAERADAYGGAGNDLISAAGVTSASTLAFLSLDGGAGDDVITGGQRTQYLYGGTGANTLRASAGSAENTYWSSSNADTIQAHAASAIDRVYDTDGLRMGGRTITGLGPGDVHYNATNRTDTVVRIRPGTPAGASIETTSLDRSGQQHFPAGVGTISASLGYVDQVPHRTLTDVVALSGTAITHWGQEVAGATDLFDVTIPTGAWSTSVVGGTVTVTPGDPGLRPVSGANVEAFRVHGPWVNKNQGFGHRVTRDLMFRFATDAARDQIRDQLTNGTRTRAQVVASLINTDEYRGLDVDRVFVSFLGRPSDPGGRSYWINAIRNGRSLQIFRAQLFGSPEYFTKAGGTNATFVQAAYADVLGRAPDPAGINYWTNKLNNGAERGQVARTFLNTTEARRNIVNDQFLRFLDRTATTAEQTTWINTLGTSATGEQELIAFLTASTSYYNRS